MLDGRVVVVTGGAGLLGRAFCQEIAAAGGVAIVNDISAERAADVVTLIRGSGGAAEAAVADITDAAAIDAMIAGIRARHGRVDALVNNAYPRNARYGRKLEDVGFADFSENVTSHLGGYFLAGQRFAEDFRRHGGGNIVNMASVYGIVAPRFEVYDGTAMTMPVEYAAIKSAVIHLTRYFAKYYRASGIRCNALAPGGIRDGQPAAFQERYDAFCGTKGMLDPKDIAGPLLFLLSDASRYVTGQTLIVDDGFTL